MISIPFLFLVVLLGLLLPPTLPLIVVATARRHLEALAASARANAAHGHESSCSPSRRCTGRSTRRAASVASRTVRRRLSSTRPVSRGSSLARSRGEVASSTSARASSPARARGTRSGSSPTVGRSARTGSCSRRARSRRSSGGSGATSFRSTRTSSRPSRSRRRSARRCLGTVAKVLPTRGTSSTTTVCRLTTGSCSVATTPSGTTATGDEMSGLRRSSGSRRTCSRPFPSSGGSGSATRGAGRSTRAPASARSSARPSVGASPTWPASPLSGRRVPLRSRRPARPLG